MNNPRKHHVVPQSVLSQFSIDGNGRNIFVYDKARMCSYPLPIRDAAAERDFYSVEFEGKLINFELLFDEIDSQLATIEQKLSASEDPSDIFSEYREAICTVAATQLLRTKLQRTSPAALIEQLRAISAGMGLVEPEVTSDTTSRLLHLRSLLELDKVTSYLVKKDLLLFCSTDSTCSFMISDNPVVLHNTLPYGQKGLNAPGIEIYLPIAWDRCLAFYCPSIAKIIRESVDPKHPRPVTDNPFLISVLHGIETRSIVKSGSVFVQFINSLQVLQSSRFLYCNRNDFSLAERILRKNPELKEISTLMRLGKLGEANGPAKMPSGEYLVFESGHYHHVLQIVDHSGKFQSFGIVFTTTDLSKLAYIQHDSPFDCVTLYRDGKAMQVMREAILNMIMYDGISYFHVRHRDDGLNALMGTITSRPKAT